MASLAIGSSGNDVRALQESLARAGYSPGTADGKFGQGTKRAVEAFQQAQNLVVDGKAGSATLSALQAWSGQGNVTGGRPDGFQPAAPVRPQPAPDSGRLSAPERAAPRTASGWQAQHDALARKAATKPELAFFGDSITAGMSAGDALKKSFGPKAENFGIVGDSTQHLRWRLQNGEANMAPQKAVLLIGANNVGAAKPEEIAKGIVANARELTQRMPNTKVLVVGVLPQGMSAADPRRAQIDRINGLVQQQLGALPNVKFQDVGRRMLNPDGSMPSSVWYGDGLHPKSYSRFFDAIRPTLDGL